MADNYPAHWLVSQLAWKGDFDSPDKENDISLSVWLQFINGDVCLENQLLTQYRTPIKSDFEKTCFFPENAVILTV